MGNHPQFEEAFAAVQKLAEDFHANRTHYLSPQYQESEVRTDFINKFLIALGWDVNHDWQKNPFQQEVKVERSVNMGTATQRRADYAFYIHPNFRKDDVILFVEAKKPFGDIATPDNCFQTIRYGWNAGTPIAILTDFEQLQILDCRYKPSIDTARTQVLRKYHYADYSNAEKFAEIFHLFSHDAVAAGSLDKYAADLPKRRGKGARIKGDTQTFDDAFLEELDEYRDILARAFKNKNPDLEGETLTEITQRTLDRLVFMRFLEDKQILPDYLVAHFGQKNTAWQDFIAAARKLDGIYNGIVFKPHSILDAPTFHLDDDAFADICKCLSHVNTPYDFNAIPIHILGSIYERFLGKVITTTDKRAKVEEKPEVRKAGGVYYTPEYIVRYIVENTVGKLIEGKTPAQIAELRFADIACGSGSFLLGVYDRLLRYHLEWYNANPDKAKKAGCVQREDGAWHLTLKQRREILVNNIYGVDIDHQAVEVAQLSLYLKLLEEETTGTAREFQMEFHETLLPTLNKNIVCGNSLIGTDILTGQLLPSDEERKLNPMDFEQRFPQIFKVRQPFGELRETSAPLGFDAPGLPLHGNFSYKIKKEKKSDALPVIPKLELTGGFDAIVGNPPYVIISNELMPRVATEYLNCYPVAEYKTDLFHLFLQRAVDLVKRGGLVAYIVPNTWLTLMFTKRLRHFLLDHAKFKELVILEHQVFQAANVHTCLTFLEKGTLTENWTVTIKRPPDNATTIDKLSNCPTTTGCQQNWRTTEGYIIETRVLGSAGKFVKKLIESYPSLEQVARASLGCQAYNSTKHTKEQIEKRVFHATEKLSDEYLPELAGNDVSRYIVKRSRGMWIKYGSWLHDYRTLDWLQGPRILIREIPGKQPYALQSSYVTETFCNYKTILNVNPSAVTKFSMLYLLGILNSRLISFLYPLVSNKMVAQAFPRLSVRDLKKLPICNPDFSRPSDKARHDRIVALVDQMLAAQKQLVAAQSDKDKDFYGHKCAGLDQQIDALVYELYGLTPEEIKIVEGTTV